MRKYHTIDFLPDLKPGEISAATALTWDFATSNDVGWDYQASVNGSEPNALLHSLYSFKAYEGRTYDIFSVSYLDPYLLRLYDQYGNVIEVNSESNDPEDFKLGGIPHGVDFIEDWIAPYTGTFYVEASWNQGTANKFYRLSVNEDINTVTSEPLSAKAARIFNWGESKFSSLFPDHPESEIISDYYARFYSNGNALAEKNGNVYFYNGETESIALVGTVSGFLPSAIADGF